VYILTHNFFLLFGGYNACIVPPIRGKSKYFGLRRKRRGIKPEGIKKAIHGGEIVEQYPADMPYPSCLVLGRTDDNRPLHVVCAVGKDRLWLITSYYPTLDKWENDYKTRKGIK